MPAALEPLDQGVEARRPGTARPRSARSSTDRSATCSPRRPPGRNARAPPKKPMTNGERLENGGPPARRGHPGRRPAPAAAAAASARSPDSRAESRALPPRRSDLSCCRPRRRKPATTSRSECELGGDRVAALGHPVELGLDGGELALGLGVAGRGDRVGLGAGRGDDLLGLAAGAGQQRLRLRPRAGAAGVACCMASRARCSAAAARCSASSTSRGSRRSRCCGGRWPRGRGAPSPPRACAGPPGPRGRRRRGPARPRAWRRCAARWSPAGRPGGSGRPRAGGGQHVLGLAAGQRALLLGVGHQAGAGLVELLELDHPHVLGLAGGVGADRLRVAAGLLADLVGVALGVRADLGRPPPRRGAAWRWRGRRGRRTTGSGSRRAARAARSSSGSSSAARRSDSASAAAEPALSVASWRTWASTASRS